MTVSPHYKYWDLFPFSQYSSSDYKALIFSKLDKAQQDLDSIIYQSEEPSFENTILRLEQNAQIYNRLVEVFFNLNSASTDDTLQKDAHEIAEKLSAYNNSVILNEALFARIKKVYEGYQNDEQLDDESKKLLEETYTSFVRNGASLTEEDKSRVKTIDAELAQLSLKFADNVLAETNNQFIHITDKSQLTGLNDEYLNYYAQLAQAKGLDGYVINLQFPSYVPFMKYCSNRSLRERLYGMYMSRGGRGNEFDNRDIIKRILALKYEKAQLLGFDSHAEYVLQRRMAGSPNKVTQFLEDLLERALPFAHKDLDELKSIAKDFHIDEVQAYDHAYLAEKLREKKYNYSDEALKPYLSLESCLQAVFDLSGELYGLNYKLLEDVEKYHPDVQVYEVTEGNEFKAILYVDFYARDNKKPGAWMTVYKNQRMEGQINIRPHISIVCNFSPAQEGQPALLNFDEFQTLFHEFGHALHGILADTKYESMSGTNVYWDFVELPSQFMENFCYNKSFLKKWTKHYQTGEAMPDELIDKVIASNQYMEAYQTVRQLSFGLLDLAYHSQKYDSEDVLQFERKAIERTQLYPYYGSAMLSTSFSHIFAGGYDAGYYSYKWSEVIDADAYAYIESQDFNPEIIAKFKYLLSKGGTIEPMELYKSFRGQEPDTTALLKRAGINN